jgi:hypothetical protein
VALALTVFGCPGQILFFFQITVLDAGMELRPIYDRQAWQRNCPVSAA